MNTNNFKKFFILNLWSLFFSSSVLNAQCSLSLTPSVSGCYQSGGLSKATVSVEVAWTGAPSGDSIAVTLGTQTRYIKPGVISVNYGYGVTGNQIIVSPQVVAFEIDANGAAGSVSAAFTTDSGCSDTKNFTAPTACAPLACSGNQTGGTVFNDYDADGVKDTGETTGLSGVTVKAFDCNGNLVGTTTTDAYGKYVFSGLTAENYPIRVEFSDLSSVYGKGTPNGTNGRTTTQFVASANCNIDLGVLDPNDYCQTNPTLYIPCYVSGDPLVAGTAASMDANVSVPYSYSGVPGQAGYTSPTHIATAAEVGSLWGTTYNANTKHLFQSATLHRHVGLGPQGIGGIYVTNLTTPATPSVGNFINVITDLGIDVVDPLNPVPSNSVRGLTGDKTAPSNDSLSIAYIGRTGIGGLDLSTDGNDLWFVNMYDKKLYKIDISAYNSDGTTKPTAANKTAYTIPDPNCTGGTARPYAVKIYKGEAYVGVVCDGSTSQNKSDLRAYVYKLSGSTWTTVFDFPLTYPKGPAVVPNIPEITGWYPWTDNWNTMTTIVRDRGSNKLDWTYPTPLLSDIEFDIDGSMILALMDRTGMMSGNENYRPIGTTYSYSNNSGGDVLKAYYSGNTYILENAAKAGPYTGASPTNSQGPGFGEFYDESLVWTYNGGSPSLEHTETALGGLALRPGSGETIITAFDPENVATPANFYPNPFNIGGFIKGNNTTGAKNSGYAVFQGGISGGVFAKAASLGDVDIACSTPQYLQVGNYVWLDTDKDGVQDPCEAPLSNITVSLWKNAVLIASTTTDANGEYYFSDKNAAGVTWTGTGADTTLLPSTAYQIKILKTQTKLDTTLLTTANVTTNSGNDQNDSDASMVGDTAVISLTTGMIGSTNHTYDFGFAPCAIKLTPSVSGCYQSGGVSKATVSVEVAWENAVGDSIKVTFGTQTKYIKIGTFSVTYQTTPNVLTGNQVIVSPQVIAFEVDADGSTSNITASFTDNAACNETVAVILPAACVPTVCSGQLGGTVFNDYNADGVKSSSEATSGVAGVTVKVIDCNGNVQTTTTNITGQWLITSSPTYPVRVEFSTLPAYAGAGTFNGTDGKTTTQFVASADCNVDLGILNPSDYCQTNPKIMVPCYIYGDPQVGSAAGQRDALVMFNYDTRGTKDVSKITMLAKAEQVGTTWGLAYNKDSKKLYTSAILKRHAGLGPLGLGGIYVTDLTTNTTTSYVDVAATLNINVGGSTASDPYFGITNTTRGLVTDPTQPSADSMAFNLASKVGIGDLEISEDNHFLYFTNLYDKKLYKLDISGASPTVAGSWTIPDPNCTGGNYRAFALKYYQNKVYVGALCDAQTSQNKSDMRAYVYAFDPSSSNFNTTPVFDFPLTYPKGFPNGSSRSVTGWYPWTDDFNKLVYNTNRLSYPQPIFTDIEFDLDGSMILAFGDRTGIQSGSANYRPSGANGISYSGFAGGDILRATYTGGNFILENNAKVPNGTAGYGENNNQGPGFGEFYNDDYYKYDAFYAGPPYNNPKSLTHSEIVFGALALRPGSGEVVVTTMDPINETDGGTPNSGGVRYLSNTTGQHAAGLNAGFVLYFTNSDVGTFSKSTGLGDLELGCATPQYLQVGNYVWQDTNKDGVQDPCEAPLSNVTVSLWKGGTQIASTTTDANGEYYFSDKNASGVTWTGTGADTTLLPSMAYEVRIDTSNQATFIKLALTAANSTVNNGNDQNDNDAVTTSQYKVISFTTGAAGSVNHTLDFGFYPFCDTTLVVTNATTCSGTAVDLFTLASGVKGTLSYSTDGTTWTALTSPTNVTPSVTTTYYIKDTLVSGCFDIDTLVITVNPQPTTPSVSSPITNICPLTTVDLTTISSALTPSVSGGVFEWHVSNSSSSAMVSNPNDVVAGDYYLFEKSPAGCYSVGLKVTVAIQVCCPPKVCIPVTVTRNTGNN